MSWTNLEADSETWAKALKDFATATTITSAPKTAAANHIAVTNALIAAKKFHEIFIGGDDSPCLIQVLAANDDMAAAPTGAMHAASSLDMEDMQAFDARVSGESDSDRNSTDFLASVLLPEEEVKIAHTVRGPDVFYLLLSFWAHRPQAPTLIQSNGTFVPLYIMIPDIQWSTGVLSAKHVQFIKKSSHGQEAETLEVYAPGEEAGGKAIPTTATSSSSLANLSDVQQHSYSALASASSSES